LKDYSEDEIDKEQIDGSKAEEEHVPKTKK